MKTLLLTGLLTLVCWIPAETLGSNYTTTGFVLTLYRYADNQTYTHNMPAGFDNVGNKWQLVAGSYRVTFTPVNNASYGPTSFGANGSGTTRTNTTNTGAVTLNNVQIYEGGGNQIMINPL